MKNRRAAAAARRTRCQAARRGARKAALSNGDAGDWVEFRRPLTAAGR